LHQRRQPLQSLSPKRPKNQFTYPQPANIILAGMGGSAIGGELLKDFTRRSAKVPIEVSREYRLPSYADKNSLVILASYSGDTEETLSSFLDAKRRGCMMFCISSGGALLEYAEKLGVPFLQVKSGMPPRGAMPHMLVPLIEIVESWGWRPPTFLRLRGGNRGSGAICQKRTCPQK
jgi:glucose/mannose-6-phosphate isomerase